MFLATWKLIEDLVIRKQTKLSIIKEISNLPVAPSEGI